MAGRARGRFGIGRVQDVQPPLDRRRRPSSPPSRRRTRTGSPRPPPRRAPTEADEKHRKIFAAIIDESISDDELDEMAKALDGFQVMTVLQAKSTGRIGVVVAKMDGRDTLQRTIVTRKEKEGWKVLDIEQDVRLQADARS